LPHPNLLETTVHLARAIPIIRIFSEEKAREFYIDFLGFTWEWEHRFEENFPLYAQVRRSDLVLHLSEHHGDATPGSAIFVQMEGVDALHDELQWKDYRYGKPGVEVVPWGKCWRRSIRLGIGSGFVSRWEESRGCVERSAGQNKNGVVISHNAVCKTIYNLNSLGWLMGLEPTTTGITILDSTN
jgi:Glyoxalase superfamily protein